MEAHQQIFRADFYIGYRNLSDGIYHSTRTITHSGTRTSPRHRVPTWWRRWRCRTGRRGCAVFGSVVIWQWSLYASFLDTDALVEFPIGATVDDGAVFEAEAPGLLQGEVESIVASPHTADTLAMSVVVIESLIWHDFVVLWVYSFQCGIQMRKGPASLKTGPFL